MNIVNAVNPNVDVMIECACHMIYCIACEQVYTQPRF